MSFKKPLFPTTSLISIKKKIFSKEAQEILDFFAIMFIAYSIIFSIFYALWLDFFQRFSLKAMIIFMLVSGGLLIRYVINPFIKTAYKLDLDAIYAKTTFWEALQFLGIAGSLIFILTLDDIANLVGSTLLLASTSLNYQSPITILIFYTSIAFAEEVFFIHIYLLTRVSMRGGKLAVINANVLVGLLWVLFHRVVYGVEMKLMVILFIARVVFNLGFEFTKKISVPMMCHSMWNLVQAIRIVVGV